MARALKVFRTAAGFHDAYVAAPSRKAALEAWGSNVDLFARGIAEQVTDPALTKEPLGKPGEVIMISRGGLADQLKAMGPPKKRAAKKAEPKSKAAKPKKPPSRARLDAAEKALETAERAHAAELKKLEAQRDALDRRIEQAKAKADKEHRKLASRRNAEREAYQDALDRWSA
jgi:hypothetical protein